MKIYVISNRTPFWGKEDYSSPGCMSYCKEEELPEVEKVIEDVEFLHPDCSFFIEEITVFEEREAYAAFLSWEEGETAADCIVTVVENEDEIADKNNSIKIKHYLECDFSNCWFVGFDRHFSGWE